VEFIHQVAELVHQIVDWYFHQMNRIGLELYVFIGMLIESTFIPFPSEIVVPPAAHQAAQTHGFIRIVGLILIGTFGCLCGAWYNYFLGMWLGRPFFDKYGKYFLCGPKNMARMDAFWEKYGEGSTFIARLVPGVRQVISLPAGMSRMNLWKFTLYTGLGSGFWVTVLALVGWWLRDWTMEDFENKLKGEMLPYVLAGVALLIAFYVAKIMWQKRHPAKPVQS
jgi:membrane protein DedA with SNARE-associated domain